VQTGSKTISLLILGHQSQLKQKPYTSRNQWWTPGLQRETDGRPTTRECTC